MDHKPFITAHSGCENTAPNSIDHIRAALASGAEFLEVDVRSANGLLYLYHEKSDDPQKCVRFHDLLTLVLGETIKINCDLKENGLVRPVLEAAKEAGGDELAARMFFTGETYGKDNEVSSLTDFAELRERIWLNTDAENFASALALAEKEKCPVINVHYSVINEKTLADVRAKGMEFSAWTADDEETIRHLLAVGVRNITTRKPLLAISLRNFISHSSDQY